MKKITASFFIFLLILPVTTLSYAHYDGYKTKVKEGLVEIVKSPLVFADEVGTEYTNSEFKAAGVFGGVLKGSFYALRDIGSGIFRIITFNVEDDNYFVNKFKGK